MYAKTHLQHAFPERPNNDQHQRRYQKKPARQMRHHKAQRVDQESNDNAFSTHHGVRNIHLPWNIDSGASGHMTMNKHMFCQYTEFSKPEKVNVGGDGHPLDVFGIGAVKIWLAHCNRSPYRCCEISRGIVGPSLLFTSWCCKVV